MPRIKEVVLGATAACVAAGGILLLVLVRAEAARTDEPSIAPTAPAPAKTEPAESTAAKPHATRLPPRAPIRPTTSRTTAPAEIPKPKPPGFFSSEEAESGGNQDQAIEQRRLASLERRARAIRRRMENSERRGATDPAKAERDQQQLDSLLKQISEKRALLGLPPDWDMNETP